MLALSAFSCEKEFPLQEVSYTEADLKFLQTGKKLELALSKSVLNPSFSSALEDAVFEMEMGDTEVLISKFLSPSYEAEKSLDGEKGGETKSPRSILLEELAGVLSEKELNEFIADNPSFILAVRGDMSKFLLREGPIPVYFMPPGFTDNTTSVIATESGQEQVLSLDGKLTVPVVVLQKGERYDQSGNPLTLADLVHGDIDGSWWPGGSPIIANCPIETTILDGFTAEEANGSILLIYDIDPLEGENSTINIVISRLDPGANNFIVIEERSGDQENIFYDTNLSEGIGVQYFYRLTATITTVDGDGNTVECVAETSDGQRMFLNASASATTDITRVSSFVGQNVNDSLISYTWSPPTDVSINEYRLSYFNDQGQYEEIVRIDPTQNQFGQYTFKYPTEKRGQTVQMQLQYRSGGNTWVGDFYDRTYASFRNGNEPLRYYGIKLDDIGRVELNGAINTEFEIQENQLNGAPEIRLVAARATSNDTGDAPQLREIIVFTTNCCLQKVLDCQDSDRRCQVPLSRIISACSQSSEFSNYVPTYSLFGENGVDILQEWDNSLIGSSVTIKTTETDETEVRVTTQTITNQDTRDIDSNFGIKLPVTGPLTSDTLPIGVETQHVSTDVVMLTYPGDIDINTIDIFYHNPFVINAGLETFGYSRNVDPRISNTRVIGGGGSSNILLEDESCEALE